MTSSQVDPHPAMNDGEEVPPGLALRKQRPAPASTLDSLHDSPMTPDALRFIADGIDASHHSVVSALGMGAAEEPAPRVAAETLRAWADELVARVAVVRPTRDDAAMVVAETLYRWQGDVPAGSHRIVNDLIEHGWLAVSDSQETPTL